MLDQRMGYGTHRLVESGDEGHEAEATPVSYGAATAWGIRHVRGHDDP